MAARLESNLIHRVQVRPMTAKDIAAVLAIEQQVCISPWTKGIFQDCLVVGYSCYVWVLEQRVIGYGILMITIDEAHLLNLCVAPAWQGQGLGRRMLTWLLDLARQHRVEMVFLEVRASNRLAQKLYLSHGFNEIGLRPNYYPAAQGREDAVIMAMSLDDGKSAQV